MATGVVFPPPRANRRGGADGTRGGTPPPPQSRQFEFVLRITVAASVRSTRSSGVLQGPFLIQGVAGFFSAVDNDSSWGLEIGTSVADVSETDVAMTTVKPWDPLLESFGQANAAGHTPQPVLPFGTLSGASTTWNHWPMRIWVPRNGVRLVLSMQAQAALGNPVFTGYVSVLDGVQAESLSVVY